jgi:hypothetical protein
MDELMYYIFGRFTMRKSVVKNLEAFNLGQVMYLSNFLWNPSVSVQLHSSGSPVTIYKPYTGSEQSIHRHLAYLSGFPDERDGPYFTLINKVSAITYKNAMKHIHAERVEASDPDIEDGGDDNDSEDGDGDSNHDGEDVDDAFREEEEEDSDDDGTESREAGEEEANASTERIDSTELAFTQMSFFQRFYTSPLTGLVLFGLKMSHPSIMTIVDKSASHCTSFHVLTRVLTKFTSPNGHEVSGKQLELLATLAFIMASRRHGPAGCNMLDFLAALIREFSPMTGRNEGFLPKVPKVTCSPSSCPAHRIPLLSPMTMSSWNKPVFELLESTVGPEKLCLGVYRQSLSKEQLDGIAYYQDTPDDKVEIDLSPDQELAVYKGAADLELVDFNPPKNMKITATIESSSSLPRIAFGVECKQYKDPLGPSAVKGILDVKLSKHPDCPLLFILALEYRPAVRKMSIPGYRFLILERHGSAYKLSKISGQIDAAITVVLISLKVIWGARSESQVKALKNAFS